MQEFLIRSLDASTIFTVAALGELIGQRSGVLNVGIEGVMLFGATLGFITATSTGSYLLGFLAGIAIGGLLGLLHGFFSITLGGDQVVSGMGIWILGFGLTTYIGSPFAGPLGMDRIPSILGLSPFFFLGIFLTATRRGLGHQRKQDALSMRSDGRNAYGACRCDFLPRLQPGVELQLHRRLGLHRAGAGFLLDVESFDPVGWLTALRITLAAFIESATSSPKSAVTLYMAYGTVCHYAHRAVADVDKMVPDKMGGSHARGAREAVCERGIGQNKLLLYI
jgi:hypothetical protein